MIFVKNESPSKTSSLAGAFHLRLRSADKCYYLRMPSSFLAMIAR